MTATIQIKRTPTANNAPANGSLAQGELAVEMATPRLWVGVPTSINPNGQSLVVDGAVVTSSKSRLDALAATWANYDPGNGGSTTVWTPGAGWRVFATGTKAMHPATTGRLQTRLWLSGILNAWGSVELALMQSATGFPALWTTGASDQVQVGNTVYRMFDGSIASTVDWEDVLFGLGTTPAYYYASFNLTASQSITLYSSGLYVWEF